MRFFSFIIIVILLVGAMRVVDIWREVASAQNTANQSMINNSSGIGRDDLLNQYRSLAQQENIENPPDESDPFTFAPTGIPTGNSNLMRLDTIEDLEMREREGENNNAQTNNTQAQNSAQENSDGQGILLQTDDDLPSEALRRDDVSSNEAILMDELSRRRQSLEQREADLDRRIALLSAAEAQLVARQRSLEELNNEISAKIEQFEADKEEARASVIQTYNIMKPRAAARIFDELEMDVLINVVRSMSPRKLADIMAEMNPLKARDLTSVLSIKDIDL